MTSGHQPQGNYEVWVQRAPPWYRPVGKWPRTFFLLWGQGRCPISVTRLTAPRLGRQGCFRFCSSCWPRLSHFEEVKLIVSVINLIPQHLLKGFTACQALCQVPGNKTEQDEHLTTRNSYQALKYHCIGTDSAYGEWGNKGLLGHHRGADKSQSISNIPAIAG